MGKGILCSFVSVHTRTVRGKARKYSNIEAIHGKD